MVPSYILLLTAYNILLLILKMLLKLVATILSTRLLLVRTTDE